MFVIGVGFVLGIGCWLISRLRMESAIIMIARIRNADTFGRMHD